MESGLIARTWGNISCRISDTEFAITPSGRNYMTLSPQDIVTVKIKDLSYEGRIKPSSEKGAHATVYEMRPDVNFIIHTHQKNASAVSVLGQERLRLKFPFEKEVICASYGLPGSEKLRKGIATALGQTNGKAIIMAHHGALCMGKDGEDAFFVAEELEKTCEAYLQNQYLEISHSQVYDAREMERFFLDNYAQVIEESPLSDEIFQQIYLHRSDIKYMIHSKQPHIMAVSKAGVNLKPQIDDFAQIIGPSVGFVQGKDIEEVLKALHGRNAVMVNGNGAFCCGENQDDAKAVEMILEKAAFTFIYSCFFNNQGIKGIHTIRDEECLEMRHNYLTDYSMMADRNK